MELFCFKESVISHTMVASLFFFCNLVTNVKYILSVMSWEFVRRNLFACDD